MFSFIMNHIKSSKNAKHLNPEQLGVLFEKRNFGEKECKQFSRFLLDEIAFIDEFGPLSYDSRLYTDSVIQHYDQELSPSVMFMKRWSSIATNVDSIDKKFLEENKNSVYMSVACLLKVYAPKVANLSEIYHMKNGFELFLEDKKNYNKALEIYTVLDNDLHNILNSFNKIQKKSLAEVERIEKLRNARLRHIQKEETKMKINEKIKFL